MLPTIEHLHIFYDNDIDTDVLVYDATQERFTLPKLLPGFAWVFDVDGDSGDTVCFNYSKDAIGEHSFTVDHDIFPTLAYMDRMRHTKVLITAIDDSAGWEVLTEAVAKSEHTVHKIDVALGLGGAKVSMHLAQFKYKREFQTVYFKVADLFDALGVNPSNRSVSRWIHRYLASWKRYLHELAIDGIKKSTDYDSTVPPDPNNALDNVLPWVGLSGAGLFALLARWAFLPRVKGGFAQASEKQAAKAILSAHLLSLEDPNGVKISVFLQHAYRGKAGEPQGTSLASFFWQGGLFDFTKFSGPWARRMADHPRKGPCQGFV